MKIKQIIAFAVIIITIITAIGFGRANAEKTEYLYTEYPLERNGLALHLDCVQMHDCSPAGNILLVHGSSYSSHEFDIDYQDYSLVRGLAREGYAVWRIDIAGYGQSDPVADGFLPDTAYAAEDINAAVEEIVRVSGQDKIDVLGWSWGTMTAGLYAVRHPEHLGKLILYAPIVSGLGQRTLGDAFRHNTWAGAAEDFQTKEDGTFDLEITDPILIEMFCSSCWHYDGDSSPNGWSKDAFVDPDTRLIDLDRIAAPTLLIYGDKDPNLNYSMLDIAAESLPEGSEVQIIPGGSHILMYEKNCYRDFQNRILSFLEK